MVKKYVNNEKGFTLVQTLSTFILVTLLGMGLIILAFKVSEQITVTQGINDVKNQKIYAIQEAKLTLDDELEQLFSEENLKDKSLGTNQGNLEKLMKQFDKDHQMLNSGKIDKKGKVTYENKLLPHSIKQGQAIMPGYSTEQGWSEKAGDTDEIQYLAYTVTMPIESTIRDNDGERKVTSEYCYDIQWESKKSGVVATETDIWGNVYYQINRPGGLIPLSADSVMRKMSKIYHFQDETPDYLVPLSGTGSTLNGIYGVEEQYIADVTDADGVLKKDVGNIGFEGSFLVTNGFNLKGNNNGSKIVTKNLLALTSQSSKRNGITKSTIEEVSIDARTGLYLGLEPSNEETKQITINNSSKNKIEATNLVINNTISREDDKVATYIENGSILVEATNDEVTNFREYKGNSNSLNLQRDLWNEYQSGNMIISHSKVEVSSNNVRNANTSIKVDNNFMLTNAGMDVDLNEESFSYFEDEEQEIIRQPSEMILSGNSTLFEVDGYSFIDSPKRFQRQLKGDYNPEKYVYVNNQGYNKIKLEDNSEMRLGFTGVEAFVLESEKDSVFSMKILPELTLFNPYFIEKGFGKEQIEGKVILETFDEKDKNSLVSLLDTKDIPYEVISNPNGNFSKCKNGVVTIYSQSQAPKKNYEFVTRYFSYLTEVDYKR